MLPDDADKERMFSTVGRLEVEDVDITSLAGSGTSGAVNTEEVALKTAATFRDGSNAEISKDCSIELWASPEESQSDDEPGMLVTGIIIASALLVLKRPIVSGMLPCRADKSRFA